MNVMKKSQKLSFLENQENILIWMLKNNFLPLSNFGINIALKYKSR